jgi:ADP-heptose:LPS heptosyltransferase
VGSVLENLRREGRAAIIRLRSLGDCVLTTPALEILKRARPDLRVAVMVEDRFRDIFEGNPDVEELLPPRLAALRGWRPDLCLNFHGGARSAWMTALSGARDSARVSGTSAIHWRTTYTFRARRKFWAWSGRYIRRNIWRARCFIWARTWERFRERS